MVTEEIPYEKDFVIAPAVPDSGKFGSLRYFTIDTANPVVEVDGDFASIAQECRQWLADAQFEDEHGNVLQGENPTVDVWYKFWIGNIKGDNIRFNTRRNYNERYDKNIKPLIGDMLLKEVKPLHCQNVLNQMANRYANSVIEHSRLVMWMMFDSAVENELLTKNSVTKSVKYTSGRKPKEMRALTIEEQKLFLETIKGTSNYNQYALLLQTGLRTGEMIGLRWSDVDLENRVLHVRRTMEYRHSVGEWRNEAKDITDDTWTF